MECITETSTNPVGVADGVAQASTLRTQDLSHAELQGSCGLPCPRGPLSHRLFSSLTRAPHPIAKPRVRCPNPLTNDDFQLALYCCYELHYQGLPQVTESWEWEPSLLAFRRELESAFEAALRAEACPPSDVTPSGVQESLLDLSQGDGLSLSRWLLEHGRFWHAQEFAIHRSGYQLKEADPHTWAIPRLTGRAKAAMVAIQWDEYGRGRPNEMHAALFADSMRALGLDPSYGAYLERLPGVTLATINLISLFGLHRRLRGALTGHLAGFEMNSVGPMGRYSRWLEHLGIPAHGRRFYDVHVTADEVHQHIALRELVGGYLDAEPHQGSEVLFGARALAALEGAFADHVIDAWQHDRSSLWIS